MADDYDSERDRLSEMLTIYEALALVIERRHEVLDVVAESVDRDQAIVRLQETLGIEKTAARAVLDVQLLRLTQRDRARLVEERDRLRQVVTSDPAKT